MEKLLVIDGNAIIHRAYHALPPLTMKDGVIVNAVYGFASMLLKVWNELEPEYIAVTFDLAGPTFRHEKFNAYKATRVKADQALYDQIPLVHELVSAFGLPIYEKQGYEADDVIGTIVETLKSKRGKEKFAGDIYIVTGDMDTLQLVREGVKVYTLRKGISDIVVYDTAEVEKRFGFGPDLLVDYKALRGDASDNIPGVPGIGEKTAVELIRKFGSVEQVYEALGNPTATIYGELKPNVIKKLIDGKESAAMSKYLATIECCVPDLSFSLDDCKVKPFDKEKITQLFQRFEFVSLLKRIPGFAATSTDSGKKRGSKKEKDSFTFTKITDEAGVKSLCERIAQARQFACKALLDGTEVLSYNLIGLVYVVESNSFYLEKKLVKRFLPVFADPEIEVVGHNLKELVKALRCYFNVEISNQLFDVMVASYLLHPGTRAHDPASVILKVLGKTIPVSSNQTSLFGVDARAAASELYLLSQTRNPLADDLTKADNLGLFTKVEMGLLKVLADMELNGVALDLAVLKEVSVEVDRDIKKTTARIYDLAGMEFNISSPIQLREVLFEKLGISVNGIKKGKTGLSTSAEELEKMRGLHPIVDEITNYRELTKLKNTYIDVLPMLVNKKTNRLHTHFNQAVTATGRLSSSDPNLQNIPIRSELGRKIRYAFVAEPGNVLISADYSQIELRIVASLAEDKRMIEIFKKGEDIHNATAAAINNVPLDKVTKQMRYAAKEVNFGILYGMGPYGLSWRAGIPQAQAKAFIQKYFEAFSGVKQYIDRTLQFTRTEGFCETLFGRRRYIPELHSSNHQLRSAAERMAINHPIQGTAADLMKMTMIEVSKRLRESFGHPERSEGFPNHGNENRPKILLQVHDELVLEVKKEMAEQVATQVKDIMERVVTLRVPIEVGVSIGHSWGHMK